MPGASPPEVKIPIVNLSAILHFFLDLLGRAGSSQRHFDVDRATILIVVGA